MVSASSYLRRFCPLLQLGDPEAAAAREAARRLDEGDLDLRHTGASVAAAIICMSLERVGAKKSAVKDVSTSIGVSMHSINEVCKKLRRHADLLFS